MNIRQRVRGRNVFVTFYKGKLEVVTISFLHERYLMPPLPDAVRAGGGNRHGDEQRGTVDLRDPKLDESVEPDESFYTRHAVRMADKKEIDLASDPPPDLAIEVEVTCRLGERNRIYRDIGVPELWRCANGTMTLLLKQGDEYEPVEQSDISAVLAPGTLRVCRQRLGIAGRNGVGKGLSPPCAGIAAGPAMGGLMTALNSTSSAPASAKSFCMTGTLTTPRGPRRRGPTMLTSGRFSNFSVRGPTKTRSSRTCTSGSRSRCAFRRWAPAGCGRWHES